MKKFIRENWFKIITVIILMIITSLYAFGQYSYYQKQQAQIQLNWEKQESELELKREKQEAELKLREGQLLFEIEKKEKAEKKAEESMANLDICLISADKNYTNYWNKECERLGKEIDCILPESITINAGNFRKQLKDECFKKYPQQAIKEEIDEEN
ncbi:hypothetical protein KAT63_03425 [Candidatus Parcubacteria bacterium]|nr:hypothetical protein [Candidatus Parcubacteria bacterium]